jgi:hypothetical protein
VSRVRYDFKKAADNSGLFVLLSPCFKHQFSFGVKQHFLRAFLFLGKKPLLIF